MAKGLGLGCSNQDLAPVSGIFRNLSVPYVLVGAMAEQKVAAHVKLFLNLENLTNVRQTRWDPVLLPSRASDGRWTVDAWAPLDGRIINGGARFSF